MRPIKRGLFDRFKNTLNSKSLQKLFIATAKFANSCSLKFAETVVSAIFNEQLFANLAVAINKTKFEISV